MRSSPKPPADQRRVRRSDAGTRLRRPPQPPERWRGAFLTWSSASEIAGRTCDPARDFLYYAPSYVRKLLMREILRAYKTLRTRAPRHVPRRRPVAIMMGGRTGVRRSSDTHHRSRADEEE